MASSKTKEKARLVARGFQELREGMTDTYSPTCSRNCLRLLLALCATEGWVPSVIDVTTAFLQGKTIKWDVYLRPPKEAMEDSDRLWKLLVTVYGLCDAQRACYDTVEEFFTSIGGRRMLREAAVFVWMEGPRLKGFIATHVDDFLWAGVGDFKTRWSNF